MKRRIILLILINLMVLFSACEKTIEFNGTDTDPKIVVNGLVTPGNPIEITLTKSQSFLSEQYNESLSNAEVNLYIDDVFAEKLTLYISRDSTVYGTAINENMIYRSQAVAESGKTYRLEVSSPGLPPVSCQTTVPDPVNLQQVDTATEIVREEWGERQFLVVKLKFVDEAKSKDYYRIQLDESSGYNLSSYDTVSHTFEYSDTVIVSTQVSMNFDKYDPIFEGNDKADDLISGTPDNQFAIFDDSGIHGTEYTLQLKLNTYPWYSEEGSGNFIEKKILFYRITSEYYEYLKSANSHFWYADDYFSEPVPVYSNVKGGLGIFGSATPIIHTIVDGEYPLNNKVYINQNDYYNYGGYTSYN